LTSTPSIILTKRSGQSSDRPSGTVVQGGELAISRGSSDPGLYFEDTAGAIRKIGPSHYGTTAPNATPVGLPGNSVGETWADSSTSQYYFKVWTGSAWVKVGAGYADSTLFADQATTALLASGAITSQFSNTSALSSGSILASGALFASTATLSSGSILASGARFASTSTLSSGSILASGALFASTATLSSGSILASGARFASTSTLSSGSILASGALFASTATLSSGSILASGAVSSTSSFTCILASGSVLSSGTATATGVPVAAIDTALPGSAQQGTLFYQTAVPSGLYIYTAAGWAQV